MNRVYYETGNEVPEIYSVPVLRSPALSQPLMRMRRFRRIVVVVAITC